jgi:hypothetical protein
MSGFYDDASWVLIPEGIKEDVVYAQKPTNGLGDLTFTRASDATRTNSAGVIERTPWNLFQQSNTFTTTWVTNFATLTSGQTGYDGTNNAWLLSKSADNAYLRQSGLASTGTYNFSVFAKKGTVNFVAIATDFGTRIGYFDLQNGVVGSSVNIISSTIQSIGGGWYRCSIVVGALSDCRIYPASSNGSTLGTSGNILIQDAQLVEGTDAKPYFATTNRQDVPRLDYRNADGSLNSCPRLLLEPQRTNSIRNSTMVGAVAGSPGTLPTNFAQLGGGGLTRTVSVGTENGLQYIDLRYQGTATESFIEWRLDTTTAIAALPSQVWSFTNYVKLVSGTMPNAFTLNVYARNAAAGVLQSWISPASITSSLNRFQNITTATPANTAFIQNALFLTITNGATYDFTIRIAAPQMELGAYASTFIPTTTAAVTRLADAASKTGVSSLIGQTEGTLFVDMNLLVRSGNAYFALAPNLGLTSNYIGISFSATNIQAEMVSSSVAQAAIQFVNSATGNFKIAFAYKQNDLAFYVNGVLVGTDTNATVPVCSQIGLFNYFQTMALQYNQAALFPTRLTNAQLAQITT